MGTTSLVLCILFFRFSLTNLNPRIFSSCLHANSCMVLWITMSVGHVLSSHPTKSCLACLNMEILKRPYHVDFPMKFSRHATQFSVIWFTYTCRHSTTPISNIFCIIRRQRALLVSPIVVTQDDRCLLLLLLLPLFLLVLAGTLSGVFVNHI